METFDTISTMKKFIRYAAHPMLAISFENSKRIMLVTCVVCVCVCVCLFIFFHRGGFFRLQDVRDILEGADQRSYVVNINLGASAKFLHLGI